jgi:hypothetical protein
MYRNPNGEEIALILDDRSHADLSAATGTSWRGFSDRVMGGISQATVQATVIEGRRCVRLTGHVRLENNGGFIQMALDLCPDGVLDASAYTGLWLLVRGNRERYNVHLRTPDTRRPWQSYRADFVTDQIWRRIELPFTGFQPHRLRIPLNTTRLRRLGLVAIGRDFHADLALAELGLY